MTIEEKQGNPRLSSSWDNIKDLTYDPGVDSHYGEASRRQMVALRERLKAVIAEAKAQETAQSRLRVRVRGRLNLTMFRWIKRL